MINPSIIDEIKNRIDILEVVGDFVELKKSGSSYKALSPFTAEKTPSFYVVPSKGIFKDFSSGKGGDAITFVMEVDGLSYVEALKYLAGKYGIEIEETPQTDEMLAAQNRRESLFIVMSFANKLFQNLLNDHEEGQAIGQSYFKERGFSEESIHTFELGYSLKSWDHLYQTALEKGYQEDLLEEAGLVVKKEEKVYDRFRGRVVFPIHNITGKVIAFGARTLSKEKNQPKYLNSPETELYNKSRVLYGLFQAKQSIRQEDLCFLVEGYTDVISLHQAGIRNVVSSSGTSLTEEQVKLIGRYSRNVTVLFDGDAAGIRASLRGIDMLLEGGLNVRAVPLPDGEDPDSQARKLGTTAFQHFLEKESQDIILFKAKLYLDEAKGDPIKKAEVIREMVQTISKVSDPIKRSLYVRECSVLMDVSEAVLIAEQNKLLIGDSRKKQKEASSFQEIPLPDSAEEQIKNLPSSIYFQERESIRVLINYGDQFISTQNEEDQHLLNYFLAETEGIEFENPVFNRILDIFRSNAKDGKIIDAAHLLQQEDQEIQESVIELSTTKYEISESWLTKYQIPVPKESDDLKNLVYTNILRLKFRLIQSLVEQENEKLKSTAEDDVEPILREIEALKQTEMQIAKVLGNVVAK